MYIMCSLQGLAMLWFEADVFQCMLQSPPADSMM